MAVYRLSTENWQAIFQYSTIGNCTLPECMPVFGNIRLVSSYFNSCILNDPAMWTMYEFHLDAKFEIRDHLVYGNNSRYFSVLFVLWKDHHWKACVKRSGSLSLDIKIRLLDEQEIGRLDYKLVLPVFKLLHRCHSFTYHGDGRVWKEVMHYLHNSKTVKELNLHRYRDYDDFQTNRCIMHNLRMFKMSSMLTSCPLIQAPNLRCLELHDIQIPVDNAKAAFQSLNGVRSFTVDQVTINYVFHPVVGVLRNPSDRLFIYFRCLRVFRFVPAKDILLYKDEQADLFHEIVASNPSLHAIQIQYTPQLFQIISGSDISNLQWLASPMLQTVGISGQHFHRERGGRPVLKKTITNLTNAIAKYRTSIQTIRFGHLQICKAELEGLQWSMEKKIKIEHVKCRLLTCK
jgi:hypothetical protein